MVVEDGQVVGVMGCYAVYRDGVEAQVDTHCDHRRRGIAHTMGVRFLAEAGRRSRVVHWDAMNAASASLAERLGFTPDRSYRCLQVS